MLSLLVWDYKQKLL